MKNARRRKRDALTVAAVVASAGLVTNHGSTKPESKTLKAQFAQFACNSSAGLVRNDTMEGKDFLVVPMIMMLEGVHTGSGGPLYYPADELSKTPEVWNHKPVVVYHPTQNGKGISACSPDVLSAHKIGVIMNAHFTSLGQLKAEAWLEEERVKKVDERILNAIQEKKILELSTGLFTDNEMTDGEYEGDKYVAIARNYRPDHLAVLPDKIGACSVADGAGFCRNELIALTGAQEEDLETLRGFIVQNLQKAAGKKGPIQNVLNRLPDLVNNELSHESLRSKLCEALEKRFPPPSGDQAGYGWPYVESVFEDFLVYSMAGKLFRIGYSKSDTGVTISGSPKSVVRVTEYRTEGGSPVGNAAGRQLNQTETKDMKKELVDGLIANGGYSEESRTMLMGLEENVLKSMTAASAKLATNAKSTTAPAEAPKTAAAAVVVNEVKKPATHADFLASAPAETQAIIRNAERVLNSEKEKHVATITANAANKFTKEQLMGMDVSMLEHLAALAGAQKPAAPAAPDFSGAGITALPLVANATGEDKPLLMPTMSFVEAAS